MMRRVAGLLTAVLCSACQTATGVGLTGEPAPGVAAGLVHETLQVAGGRPRVAVVTYDSATATFAEQICPDGDAVPTCVGVLRRSGSLDRQVLVDLWRMVASVEFRLLRPYYGFSGGMVPPDFSNVTLTVVANGRRWRVSRDARATSPAILGRVECRLLVAQGMLISCA